MATALAVARAFLILATETAEPEPISNLRLQKLLYYAQGWSLALRGKPIFADRIEAWALGPVVPTVYHKLKSFGYGAISADAIKSNALTNEESSLIGAVWEVYKPYSGTQLSSMTHVEDPWKDARGNLKAEAACGRAIPQAAMKTYFTRLSKRK